VIEERRDLALGTAAVKAHRCAAAWPRFDALRSSVYREAARLMVFDLLELDGEDMRAWPLEGSETCSSKADTWNSRDMPDRLAFELTVENRHTRPVQAG
jgi:hypothetical protein